MRLVYEIPPFHHHGILPAGDYPLTLRELRQSRLVTPISNSSLCRDKGWRIKLVDNVKVMAKQARCSQSLDLVTAKSPGLCQFYRVELYPHIGQLSGIRDEFGNDLEFPAAFRKSRAGNRPKGIIKLLQE